MPTSINVVNHKSLKIPPKVHMYSKQHIDIGKGISLFHDLWIEKKKSDGLKEQVQFPDTRIRHYAFMVSSPALTYSFSFYIKHAISLIISIYLSLFLPPSLSLSLPQPLPPSLHLFFSPSLPHSFYFSCLCTS